MASVQLTNELDVAEKSVLSLECLLFVVFWRVSFAFFFSLPLESLVVARLEDLFEQTTTVVKHLSAERAEFKLAWNSLLALRLKIDFDDGGAELTVELRVGVLDLCLSEDGLHHDLENFLIDLETIIHCGVVFWL